MGIILFIVCLILIVPTTIVSFLHVWIKYGTPKGYFLNLAIDIDIFANRSFRSLWNSMLLTDHIYVDDMGWVETTRPYRFGTWGQTMSYVLGRNQQKNTLSKLGIGLCAILDFLDKNHCAKAVENAHANGRY